MVDDAKVFAEEHLDALKERLRIMHQTEDDKLKRILASSVVAIAKLVGASRYDDSLVELSCERSMFVYNDALDEFRSLYADEIEDLYITNLIIAREGVSYEERENH